MSPERVSVGEVGEGQSTQMDRKQKGAGTNSGESGARNQYRIVHSFPALYFDVTKMSLAVADKIPGPIRTTSKHS